MIDEATKDRERTHTQAPFHKRMYYGAKNFFGSQKDDSNFK